MKTFRRLPGKISNRGLARVGWLATLALASAGVLLAIQGQQLFLAKPPQEDQAIAHYLIGATLFALAFVWQRSGRPDTVGEPALRIDGRLFWFLGWATLLNLLALLLFQRDENSNTAWWLFLASLVVLVGGVASSQRVPVDGPVRAVRDRLQALGQAVLRRLLSWQGLEIALLLGIVGLASALRFLRFDSLPEGIWYDEAEYGLLVRRILSDDSFRPIYAPLGNLASPYLFFIAASFKLFGDGILSLRLISVLAGIATVPVFYFLARRYIQVPAAMAATLLLAVSFWHINFSRIGLQGILTPLVTVIAFLFLLRAWRGGRLIDFALAGVSVSAGVWAYNASNLLPIVAAMFLAFAALREWRLLRKRTPGVLLFGFAALIAISPLAMYAIKNQDQYFMRSKQTSIFLRPKGSGWEWRPKSEWLPTLKSNLRAHLLMFNYRGDPNGRHNLPGHRMLDDVTGVLAVLGLAYVVSRALRPEYFLLLAGFAVGLAGGIITLAFEAPQSLRSIMALPMPFLFAGIALNACWQFVTAGNRLRLPRAALATTGMAALVAWAGVSNYDVFFNQKAHDFASWSSYSTAPTLVAKEIKRLGPDGHYLMSSTFVGQPTLEFVDPSVGSGSQLSLDLVRDVPIASDQTTAIFLDPEYEAYIPWLRTLYPEAAFRMFTVPGASGPAALYEMIISPEEIKAIQGVDAIYTPATGALPLETREPALDLDWTAGTPVPLPFDAHWSGVINVPQSGEFLLTMEAPGQVRLLLDGQLLGEGLSSVQASKALYKGQHRLEVMAHIEAAGNVRLSANGTPLPASAYFVPPVAGHGLLGSFYSNADFSGNPVFEELDPFIGFRYHAELPWGGAVSIIWRGKVEAPSAGKYGFDAEAIGTVQVYVDGRLVAGAGAPDMQSTGGIELTQGLHDIEVRFSNGGGGARVYLRWTPLGGEREIVPSEYLYPP